MKNILITVISGLLLLSSNGLSGQPMPGSRLPLCDNYLYITGESNINQFTFTYNAQPRNPAVSDTTSELVKIIIPIKEFEASNPMMYKDFLELMKEEDYPSIFVSFSKKQIEATLKEQSEACPEISITIAGITRTYSVDCMLMKCSGNYYLKGKEIVKLSDFKLKPPTRLLGLVKVNNEIDVNFGFIVTFTDNSNFAATL